MKGSVGTQIEKAAGNTERDTVKNQPQVLGLFLELGYGVWQPP